jgi:uncharacterized protein
VCGCDYHGKCLESIISINPDGAVYPCGRFAGLEQFRLGNILEDGDLHSMFLGSLFDTLTKRNPSTVRGCSECDFLQICNTGCMITAHMARGDIYDRDYYCYGRQLLFNHIASNLKTHLEDISLHEGLWKEN